jgi:predicted ArsR family transcriptional regulator
MGLPHSLGSPAKDSGTRKGRRQHRKHPGPVKKIRCLDTGEIFASAVDVARELGVCDSGVRKHLADGETIQGLRFEYVEETKNADSGS